MEYKIKKGDIIIENPQCFNLENTLFCGQAFRWKRCEDGSFRGTVKGKTVNIFQNEKNVTFKNTDEKTFKEIWVPYFDLERDYKKITDLFRSDKYIKEAVDKYYGIRILKQEKWEALCSFIISQNNNIPRICGIIERLCYYFGNPLKEGEYSFPGAEKIATLSESDLSVIRAGFRGKYIIDAAKKISSGEINLEETEKMSVEDARKELMKIKGVGPKVAECTLLYGFSKTEAFPVDVWVKRIMSELYENGLPECTAGYEGIAQQYLFHWRRNSNEKEGKK